MKALVVLVLVVGCSDPRVLSGPCTDCTVDVHAPGIQDLASDNFHGRVLARLDWGFPVCAGCHGSDFSGGTSGVSCLGCHRAGPTACTTCHGDGPTSRAHPVHAGASVACGECHVVPTRWDDDGHLLHDGVAIASAARVTFGTRAAKTIAAADRHGAPSWDGQACSNVYCHGDASHAAGLATQPRWDAPVTGACTSCHGNPPPSHVRDDCASCHPRSAPHADGIVQLGTGCDGCHGSAGSPAPPFDLAGNQHITALGVGAHQAHLVGASRLAAPVPCATCHVVPATIDAPGHIDTPAPAEVTAGLGWDRGAQTCASSYCHGDARPVWTSRGQVSCGSCHGVPPTSAPHTPAMTLTSCAACHPGTIDAQGTILINQGTSEHINGHVDHQ